MNFDDADNLTTYGPAPCGLAMDDGSTWFCRSRTCPVCAARAAWRIDRDLSDFIASVSSPLLHVVLTIPNARRLAPQLAELDTAFTRMRRRVSWTRAVSGGVRFVDVDRAENEEWHGHLHIVAELQPGADADEVEAVIRKQWTTITGADLDAQHVAIVAEHPDDLARVSAYVTGREKKSVVALADDPDGLREFRDARKGKPTAKPFGSWHGRLRFPRRRSSTAAAAASTPAPAPAPADELDALISSIIIDFEQEQQSARFTSSVIDLTTPDEPQPSLLVGIGVHSYISALSQQPPAPVPAPLDNKRHHRADFPSPPLAVDVERSGTSTHPPPPLGIPLFVEQEPDG